MKVKRFREKLNEDKYPFYQEFKTLIEFEGRVRKFLAKWADEHKPKRARVEIKVTDVADPTNIG